MKKDFAFYRKLFCSTFYLSAFTFGGGYVIIPLMRKKFVEQYHWIEEEEMLDLTAIAQSSPGAIAVNASILIGYRLAGPNMMRMGSQSFFLSTSQPIEMTTSAMTAATPACMARSTSCTIRLFWKAV